MITAARFRTLALGHEGAREVPHFDRAAFRTERRIFATLAGDGASANLMFDLESQEIFCAKAPEMFAPVPGGWGRMGATTVRFDTATEAMVKAALAEAHARANEPRRRKTAGKGSARR